MPVNEHLFPSARLRRGHRALSAEKTLVQVEWAEDADGFDVRSGAVVATAVADVEVPANGCPLAAGQVWEVEAHDRDGAARLEALAVRLVSVRDGHDRFHRRYTWQFLVVRKPARDPYQLFPRPARPATVDETPEGDADILGDLKQLLASEIGDRAVARFSAEGGFRLQPA